MNSRQFLSQLVSMFALQDTQYLLLGLEFAGWVGFGFFDHIYMTGMSKISRVHFICQLMSNKQTTELS